VKTELSATFELSRQTHEHLTGPKVLELQGAVKSLCEN
jgi:hypothetical protein